jgi:hypothetical protein
MHPPLTLPHRLAWASCALLALAACAGADRGDGSPPPAGPTPFLQPPGTVSVDFSVDDRANRVYAAGQLKMKASMLFNPATRRVTLDDSWSGAARGGAPLSGWPTLYDDGPWTEGGHEPIGATAGDHVWGVTFFATPPASGTDVYDYGLIDVDDERSFGDGWIWIDPNGTFAIAAGATAPVVARGMKLDDLGNTDLELSLDTSLLSTQQRWSTSTVRVKSSAWGWNEQPMTAQAAGLYTLRLSSLLGQGGLLPRGGLLHAGDDPEFVFVLGGVEYKGQYQVPQGEPLRAALTDGVSASFSPNRRLGFYPLPVQVGTNWAGQLRQGNTFVHVPWFEVANVR